MQCSLGNFTPNPEEVPLLLISAQFLTSMQTVNFFMGIPLNICFIILMTRAGGLDESVFFAVSQSASEIIYALSAPLLIYCEVEFCFMLEIKFFNGFGLVARLMFQCLVCVERYMAVVHPVTFLKFKPLKYRLFCLIVAWIYVLTCSVALILVCDFFPVNFYGSFFLTVVIVEMFCCVSILRVLKQPAPGKRDEGGMSKTKKKAFRIVLINLLTHLIQLVPLAVVLPLKNLLTAATTMGAASITLSVNIAGGLTAPLFFLYRTGKLRITRLFAKNSN